MHRQALFRSYGCFFAEFLEDLSLVRLRLLDATTCVGLRYGFSDIKLRRFSWKCALLNFPIRRKEFLLYLGILSEDKVNPDLPRFYPHNTNVNPIRRLKYNTPSLHRISPKSWNINHVSIGFDFRHNLRPD